MTPARLRRFIGDMTSLVRGAWQDNDETATVEVGAKLLCELVKNDDWLPEAMAEIHRGSGAQFDPRAAHALVTLVASAPDLIARLYGSRPGIAEAA